MSPLPEADDQQALMKRACDLASVTRPHPNPRVGAIVLDPHGVLVGEGSHVGPGHPHAEVVALTQAGHRARGGTVIVTLEPCSHQGRTPPCVDALITAEVAGVVIGSVDPDPRVSGTGVARLRAAGLAVAVGVQEAATEDLDPGYFHHRRTGRPLVTLKVAMTLDGQIAPLDGKSRWITGDQAREDAHLLRAGADAVLVGSGTVLADDPALDVRLAGYDGPQPRPVVVVGRRPLPATAQVWRRHPLVVADHDLDLPSGQLVKVSPGEKGPDLGDALVAVGDEGYLDVIVEGGATIAAALFRDRLIDRGVFYLAGKLAGGRGLGVFNSPFPSLPQALPVHITGVARLGEDLRIEWAAPSSGKAGG